MEKYDYLQAVMDDVRNFIEAGELVITSSNIEEMREYLNEECWEDDSVTGNMSGSYVFNRAEAEENLCHNMFLLEEACDEFGEDIGEAVRRGAEYCDVTIRCYLLGNAIAEAIDELETEGFFKEGYFEEE